MAQQLTPVYHASGWYTDVCVCCNCCSNNGNDHVECDLCCAAVFCPCAVLNSNVKMLETRTYHKPCEFECNKPCGIMGCLTVTSAIVQTIGHATGVFLNLVNLGPLYSFQWRSTLREQYGIAGDPCSDCVCHFCCNSCVLCQEHIELRKRNGGTSGLPPHAVVMAQPYAGAWTQTHAPGGQVMPATAYSGPGAGGPVPVYTASVAPQGPPTVFQQPGGGVAMATMSTDQGEQPARPSADPYGQGPYGQGPYGQQEPQRAGAYYPQYPSSGKAQGG